MAKRGYKDHFGIAASKFERTLRHGKNEKSVSEMSIEEQERYYAERRAAEKKDKDRPTEYELRRQDRFVG